MGCGISGEFCSDNWRDTIRKMQREAEYAAVAVRGNYDDASYSGEINTIYDFQFKRMNNESDKNIGEYLYKQWDNLGKRDGIIIEGRQVGYAIYTPTFIDARVAVCGIKFNDKPNVLCREVISEHRAHIIQTDKSGTQAELKEAMKRLLTDDKHLDDVYYIISKTGKAIKCYNNQCARKQTTLRTVRGSVVVRPMYKYFWAGIAAD